MALPPRQRVSANAQSILATGLYDRWYGICRLSDHGLAEDGAEDIAGGPVALKRWGRDLVLWRDIHGDVHLMDDRCPHRGAPLSLARHDGDRLACIYHGAEIDGAGTVLALPGEPANPLVGACVVRRYPVQLHRGVLYAWLGLDPDAEPAPLVLPERLTSDDYEAILAYTEWRCRYRYLIDNNMDPMHGAFLHATSHSMQAGEKQATFQTRTTETGFVFEKKDQKDLNFDWSEWYDHTIQAVCLEIPYPATGGPGGNFGIVFHVTPIDENTSACFFWRHRKVSGWQRDVWRFLYRNRLEERHWHVLEQDRLIAERIAASADESEHLYAHDLGLSKVRSLMAKEAEMQARTMEKQKG